MKAILEFNFSEENDDRHDFQDAINGTKWKMAMYELDQHLRAQTKYAPDDMHEEYYKALQATRDKLHEILREDSLNMD
jgi:hypothetical protein